jgi:hypothetical protein
VDPNGEFAWVLGGAVIGAGINLSLTAIANGGFSNLSNQQIYAAVISGAVSGAAGALAGPLGGMIARAAGSTGNSLWAVLASAELSAVGGAIGQKLANVIDPCHYTNPANAALYAGIGGGIGKFFPTKNLHTFSQAATFGPSTLGGTDRGQTATFNKAASDKGR